MAAGVRRQRLDGDPRVSRVERDLSARRGPGNFAVVLSAGLLTQLIEPGSPVEDTLALRDRHLAGMARLGRRAVLVTDTVSTSTAPSLLGLGAGELEPAMAALVAAGNFFTGDQPLPDRRRAGGGWRRRGGHPPRPVAVGGHPRPPAPHLRPQLAPASAVGDLGRGLGEGEQPDRLSVWPRRRPAPRRDRRRGPGGRCRPRGRARRRRRLTPRRDARRRRPAPPARNGARSGGLASPPQAPTRSNQPSTLAHTEPAHPPLAPAGASRSTSLPFPRRTESWHDVHQMAPRATVAPATPGTGVGGPTVPAPVTGHARSVAASTTNAPPRPTDHNGVAAGGPAGDLLAGPSSHTTTPAPATATQAPRARTAHRTRPAEPPGGAPPGPRLRRRQGRRPPPPTRGRRPSRGPGQATESHGEWSPADATPGALASSALAGPAPEPRLRARRKAPAGCADGLPTARRSPARAPPGTRPTSPATTALPTSGWSMRAATSLSSLGHRVVDEHVSARRRRRPAPRPPPTARRPRPGAGRASRRRSPLVPRTAWSTPVTMSPGASGIDPCGWSRSRTPPAA